MSLIYIVEDDTDIQEVENIAMRSSGHETACFGDAESFMKAIGEKQPDLVLLDVMLPDKNGDQIVRELRADRKYHRLPVIMVTALDEPASASRSERSASHSRSAGSFKKTVSNNNT